MTCRQVQDRLSDYSAGFINGEQRRRLQAHLTACEACRERLAEFRRLDRSLAGDRVQADEALVRGVMARLPAPSKRLTWRWVTVFEEAAPTTAVLSIVGIAALALWHALTGWLQTATLPEMPASLTTQPLTGAALVLGMALIAGGLLWLVNRAAVALESI
jgi:anti-sigma factor RsiW